MLKRIISSTNSGCSLFQLGSFRFTHCDFLVGVSELPSVYPQLGIFQSSGSEREIEGDFSRFYFSGGAFFDDDDEDEEEAEERSKELDKEIKKRKKDLEEFLMKSLRGILKIVEIKLLNYLETKNPLGVEKDVFSLEDVVMYFVKLQRNIVGVRDVVTILEFEYEELLFKTRHCVYLISNFIKIEKLKLKEENVRLKMYKQKGLPNSATESEDRRSQVDEEEIKKSQKRMSSSENAIEDLEEAERSIESIRLSLQFDIPVFVNEIRMLQKKETEMKSTGNIYSEKIGAVSGVAVIGSKHVSDIDRKKLEKEMMGQIEEEIQELEEEKEKFALNKLEEMKKEKEVKSKIREQNIGWFASHVVGWFEWNRENPFVIPVACVSLYFLLDIFFKNASPATGTLY